MNVMNDKRSFADRYLAGWDDICLQLRKQKTKIMNDTRTFDDKSLAG